MNRLREVPVGFFDDFLDKRRLHTGGHLWMSNEYSGDEGECELLVPHTFVEALCVTKLLTAELALSLQCFSLTSKQESPIVIDYKWCRSLGIRYTIDICKKPGLFALSFALYRLPTSLADVTRTYKKGQYAEREQICDALTMISRTHPSDATVDVGLALFLRTRLEMHADFNAPSIGWRNRYLVSSAWFWTAFGECKAVNTKVSQPVSPDPKSGLGALLGVPGRKFAYVSPHRLLIPNPDEMVARIASKGQKRV